MHSIKLKVETPLYCIWKPSGLEIHLNTLIIIFIWQLILWLQEAGPQGALIIEIVWEESFVLTGGISITGRGGAAERELQRLKWPCVILACPWRMGTHTHTHTHTHTQTERNSHTCMLHVSSLSRDTKGRCNWSLLPQWNLNLILNEAEREEEEQEGAAASFRRWAVKPGEFSGWRGSGGSQSGLSLRLNS